MSSQEEAQLKAGHPPAVKVAGGVRITQHKSHPENEPKTKEELEEEKKYEEAAAASNADQRVLVSGAVSKGHKDFPPEAVKAFHEKPMPTHHEPTLPGHQARQDHNIMQPRRH